ncbi:putative Ig domain-containing protein [Larkinella bovis]|uniref:Ig domain-containing protein n=1 Tax=Larkinella bovis TaxID=683041 RepID=A0ABW0I6W5_9BACT
MKNRFLPVVYLTVFCGLNLLSFWGKAAALPDDASAEPVSLRTGALRSAPVPINQQRYIGLTIFNFESDPRVDDAHIENSAAAGCNAVEITINWDKIYPTTLSTANWSVVDSHVKTAERLGLKIALRVFVGRSISKLGGFWGTDETMKSADGSRMDGGSITQFSFAHQPTVDMARNFVRETVSRYRYLQDQNKLLFVSVVASPALESEYSPVHHKADGTKYVVAFDYGDQMKQAFRQWLQSRFSLSTLNSRWGANYTDWSAVNPPIGRLSDPYSLFNNQTGKDWYVFRHRLLQRFMGDMINTIKSVNSSIRVVNQHGAVWDRLSGLRATYAFKSLNQNADGMKFNDGPTYNHRFSMDLVRSNLQPGAFMINAVDGMFWQTVSIDTYFRQVTECFEHGASMLTLANFSGRDAQPTLRTLIARVIKAGLLDQPVTQVQTAGSISYKLSEILKDSYGPIAARWTTQYNNSGKKAVQVNLIEDLMDDNETPAEPVRNQSPQVSKALANSEATVGTALSLSVGKSNFMDPDGTIARVEVSGLPAGLSYNASASLISGTPTTVTTATVTVKATDNEGASVTTSFQLLVKAASTPEKPAPEPEPVPQPSNPATGSYEGYLDKVECESIRGWVWDRKAPNAPVIVEFYADGKAVGTTEASIYRDDLQKAGKGNGAHAYSFTTPSNLKDGKTHVISAKVLHSSYTLSWAPKNLTCEPSGQPVTNQSPQVSKALANFEATVGTALSLSVGKSNFMDPDGTIARVEVSGLPAGLSYNASASLISGTPTTVTTATVTVKATDNEGASVTTSFQLLVKAASTPEKPAPEPEPVPQPSNPATGSYEGYLDKVECGSIRGWVWDRKAPNAPVIVEFYADGKAVGTTEASIYRDDLQKAGKGNGAHAYSFTTPSSLKDGKTHVISAKVLHSSYTLKWAPQNLNCPSPARLSAEPTERGLEVTVLGNPVSDQIAVEVRGAAGKPVLFQLVDIRGRIVAEQRIESARGTEAQQFNVSQEQPGMFLLRVASGIQFTTVKVLKR